MTGDGEGKARRRLSQAERDEQSRRRRAEVLALPMVPVCPRAPGAGCRSCGARRFRGRDPCKGPVKIAMPAVGRASGA